MGNLKLVKNANIHLSPRKEHGSASCCYTEKIQYDGEKKRANWLLLKKDNKTEGYKRMQSRFYENLKAHLEVPSPADNILWPLDLTENSADGFAYVTEDCSSGYMPLKDYLEGKAFFSGWSIIVNAALGLSALFLQLKERNYHFVDLSNEQILVHSQNGRVLLAGAECLTKEEKICLQECSVLMSPEYITKKQTAGERTDEYLLAVLLFELFFRGHPLEGLKTAAFPIMTAEHKKTCYGESPVFVYDPRNESNRPVRGIHINVLGLWKQCPNFMRNMFEKAFDARVMTGKKRGVTAEQWYRELILLRSVMVRCNCGMDNFIPLYMEDSKGKCVRCRSEIENPVIFWKPAKEWAVAYPVLPGGILYRCQLAEKPETDFRTEIGRFTRNKDSGLCLLQNVSNTTWSVQETQEKIEPGETIPVKSGLTIEIEEKRCWFDLLDKKENEE